MRKKIDKELLDTMHKDPGNWKGVFYFNPKDPRITVPKITGLGWTFNFASPFSYLLLFAIIMVIVAAGFFV